VIPGNRAGSSTCDNQVPNGHEGIDRGLELQKEIHVEPAVFSPAQTPDEIAFPGLQAVADEAGIDLLEGGEVKIADPVLVNEAAQEIGHHLGMREEQLVGMIVVCHKVAGIRIQGTSAFVSEISARGKASAGGECRSMTPVQIRLRFVYAGRESMP
jgi:hypothetical protein